MKSILFLTQLPPPYYGVTCVSNSVYATLKSNRGFSITHLWKGGARSMADIGKKTLGKYLGFLSFFFTLVRYWVFQKLFDITYLTFTPWSHVVLRDALLFFVSKRISKRTLVHLHTEGLHELLESKKTVHQIVRFLMKNVELITITQEANNIALKSNIFKRVHLLSNMVDDCGPRPETFKNSNEIICGYLGNYDERKGVLQFIDILADLKSSGLPVRGIIHGGSTKDIDNDKLKSYVASKNAIEYIDVKGFIEEDLKSEFYFGLDIFLYPTRHDHAPIVLLETLAHSTVPISLQTGGILSLLSPEFKEHVLPATDTHDELSQKVRSLLERYNNDKTILERHKEVAREVYLSRFSPSTFQNKIIEIFNLPKELT